MAYERQRHLFLTVLWAGKSKIKVSTGQGVWQKHLILDSYHFSLCPHVAEGARDLSEVSSVKGTNPVYEGSTLRI